MSDCRVRVDGRDLDVPPGTSVAAVVALAGTMATRVSAVRRTPRGPLCGMGICFECRVTVDGEPHVRSCMTACRPGMEISTGG